VYAERVRMKLYFHKLDVLMYYIVVIASKGCVLSECRSVEAVGL
jgi:hypothetical protein